MSATYAKRESNVAVIQPADTTQSFTATYDAWNRLVKLEDGANTVAEYEYDGAKRRVIQKSYTGGTLDETRHLYYTEPSMWQVIEERVDTDTDPDRQFVWGLRYIDDLVLRDRDTDANGSLDERFYPTQDANWNVTALVDTGGAVQERYAYSAYGVPMFLDGSYGSRASSSYDWEILFDGYRYDPALQMFHVRNRTYHPELGVWVQRDPIGYADGMSLYCAYFVPSGLDPLGLQFGGGRHFGMDWGTKEEAARRRWQRRKDQQRLEYLHCIMKWANEIIDFYSRIPCFRCMNRKYPDIPKGLLPHPNIAAPFKKATFRRLADMMKYSYTKYPTVGPTCVDVGTPLGGGNARNLPGVPGFAIKRGQCELENPADPIGSLTHEPQHDFSQGGIGGHNEAGMHDKGFRDLGTNLEDAVSDLFSWLEAQRDPTDVSRSLLDHIRDLCGRTPPVLP